MESQHLIQSTIPSLQQLVISKLLSCEFKKRQQEIVNNSKLYHLISSQEKFDIAKEIALSTLTNKYVPHMLTVTGNQIGQLGRGTVQQLISRSDGRLSLIIDSNITYGELYEKELQSIDLRERALKEVVAIICDPDNKRKISIFGGFVRDYVENGKSLHFMKFKDIDVRCKSGEYANKLINALSKNFFVEFNHQSVCRCKGVKSKYENITTTCSSKYCRFQHSHVTRVKVENEFEFDLIVNSVTIIHKIDNSVRFDMDIVIDPSSFRRNDRRNYDSLVSLHPDITVNQLYFNYDMKLLSMVDGLEPYEIEQHIMERKFGVFYEPTEYAIEHVVTEGKFTANIDGRPFIVRTFVSEDNKMCIYRDAYHRLNDPYNRDSPDTIPKAQKIKERVDKMLKRGYTCMTCPNKCTNPRCIFSADEDYATWVQEMETYEAFLKREKLKQIEMRRQMIIRKAEQRQAHTPYLFMIHAGKARKEIVREKKCESHAIENRKKENRIAKNLMEKEKRSNGQPSTRITTRKNTTAYFIKKDVLECKFDEHYEFDESYEFDEFDESIGSNSFEDVGKCWDNLICLASPIICKKYSSKNALI